MSRHVFARWWFLALIGSTLTGCVSIPDLPIQHILMFDGAGHPADPTGNVNCPDGGVTRSRLCNSTDHLFRNTHSYLDHPRLTLDYYANEYLPVVLKGLSTQDGVIPRCRAQPGGGSPCAPDDGGRTRRILIFIHGGLNTQVGALERVSAPAEESSGREPLYQEIRKAGYHPIFVNWQSNLFSSYLDQLFFIRQGEARRWIGPVTAPVTFAIDMARSLVRAPLTWSAQISNDLHTTPPITSADQGDADLIATDLVCAYQYATSPDCARRFRFAPAPLCLPYNVREPVPPLDLEPSISDKRNVFPVSIGEDHRGCGDMDVRFVSYMLTMPTRVLLGPVVDVFGTSAWENMRRRTELLFSIEDEFKVASVVGRPASDLANRHAATDGVVNIPRSGGLSTFLAGLSQHLVREGGAWEVTLVGHSMGAIVLNQMLREANQRGLVFPVRNIVYLAAASSVRDFQDSVLPYLRREPQAKFFNLTLHPIAEARESYELVDIPLDPGPRGSLLVMIDNFLARPLTPLDRTAGRYENFVRAMHAIPQELRGQVHLKVFSVGDSPEVRSASPQRHGEFSSRFRFWLEQCWHPGPMMKSVTPRECVYGP